MCYTSSKVTITCAGYTADYILIKDIPFAILMGELRSVAWEKLEQIWTCLQTSLWRYQIETFSALLAMCAGNSPVTGEFPTQRPVTRSFDVFFDLRLNERLSKQSRGRWLETPSRPLWRQSNSLSFIGDMNFGSLFIQNSLKIMRCVRCHHFSSQCFIQLVGNYCGVH